jgi:ribosomal protein S18 acetylase RimI-like enzyme
MIIVRKSIYPEDLDNLAEVIRHSFMTVAVEFGLTPDNAPTNPAFLTTEALKIAMHGTTDFFVAVMDNHIIGCVAIEQGKVDGEFYVERLAVLPEFRHQGIGRQLLDHAADEIRQIGGTTMSIGIINENTILKDWYLHYGFIENGKRQFPHLPFTVCFMNYKM